MLVSTSNSPSDPVDARPFDCYVLVTFSYCSDNKLFITTMQIKEGILAKEKLRRHIKRKKERKHYKLIYLGGHEKLNRWWYPRMHQQDVW